MPAGRHSLRSCPSLKVARLAWCEGFRITTFPMSKAGASFTQAVPIGKFHGVNRPTIPYGLCFTWVCGILALLDWDPGIGISE